VGWGCRERRPVVFILGKGAGKKGDAKSDTLPRRRGIVQKRAGSANDAEIGEYKFQWRGGNCVCGGMLGMRKPKICGLRG